MLNQFGSRICDSGCTFFRFKFTPRTDKKIESIWIKLDGSVQEFENTSNAIKTISEYEPKFKSSFDLMSFGLQNYRLRNFKNVGYIIKELDTDKLTWCNPYVIASEYLGFDPENLLIMDKKMADFMLEVFKQQYQQNCCKDEYDIDSDDY